MRVMPCDRSETCVSEFNVCLKVCLGRACIRTYIFVTVHAKRLDLVDDAPVVIVAVRLFRIAVYSRGVIKLTSLLADGLKELGP